MPAKRAKKPVVAPVPVEPARQPKTRGEVAAEKARAQTAFAEDRDARAAAEARRRAEEHG